MHSTKWHPISLLDLTFRYSNVLPNVTIYVHAYVCISKSKDLSSGTVIISAGRFFKRFHDLVEFAAQLLHAMLQNFKLCQLRNSSLFGAAYFARP